MSDDILAQSSLEALTAKIDRYKKPYLPYKFGFRFIPELEEKYFIAWKKRLYETEYKFHMWALLIYLSFFWVDILITGQGAILMLAARFAVVSVASVGYIYCLYTHQEKYIEPLSALVIFAIGASVSSFSLLLEVPLNYVYPVGLIGVQMGAILVLRYKFVLFIISSVSTYLAYALIMGYMLINNELDGNLRFLALVYIALVLCFWGFFILMGSVLSYNMEKAKRLNFVKNYLLGLEGERQNQMIDLLHKVSLTDSLTGMFNRRYFNRQLNIEWRRGMRDAHFLSVVMIDVDFFKRYNDTYGHQQGDECLKRVARLISKKSVRAGDVIARYGGEEFIWLLPNIEKSQLHSLVDLLRQEIQQMQLVHTNSPFEVVTISAGIATLVPSINASAKTLIQLADQRLYLAKEQGRNQVVS